MNVLRSLCCCWDGDGGYVAAMEWRSVQVARPRVSTSAGQSFAAAAGGGALAVEVAAATAAPKAPAPIPVLDLGDDCLACEAQAEKASLEEQARHLGGRGS
jgi:hypothetical protein